MLSGLQNLIMWTIHIAALGASLWALVDCARRRPDAFPAIDRTSKNLWLGLTGAATLVSLAGFSPLGLLGLASIVVSAIYLLDVRPKIAEITGGR
ncbi:MAG: DUF2516 family protein [Candidatus Nanopelagicales bacterium]